MSTQTKHTPGPWVINSLYAKVSDVLTVHAPNTNNAQICSLAAMRGHMDESEQTSNARLIAAAPELLDVAKAIAAEWQRSPNIPYPQRETLRAAIAKAEGRA